MQKFIIFLSIIFAFCDATKPVPHYIKTCKRNDPELAKCFANNANFAMSHIATGDKNYNINTLKPLNFRELLIVDMPPVKLMLLEVLVFGTENMTIVDPVIDFDLHLIQYTFLNPQIIWSSKYVAVIEEDGQSVQVDGKADIFFRQGKFRMTHQYELNDINGVEYANITKYNTEFLAVDLTFKLDNIDANPIIRQEWEKAKENFINQQVEQACGEIVSRFMNRILNVVPFNQIFTD